LALAERRYRDDSSRTCSVCHDRQMFAMRQAIPRGFKNKRTTKTGEVTTRPSALEPRCQLLLSIGAAMNQQRNLASVLFKHLLSCCGHQLSLAAQADLLCYYNGWPNSV